MKSFSGYDGAQDQIFLAREIVRKQSLEQYGLQASPEQVLKALLRHPDGLPAPALMRWTDQPVERPQDIWLEAFDADELRAHEIRWLLLEELSQGQEQPAGAPSREEVLAEIGQAAAALAAKYPDNPVPVQQQLQVLRLQKDAEGLEARSRELFAAHPDYLFARLSLAEVLQFKDRRDEVAALFAPRFELQDYAPAGRLFHISEIAGFYSLIGLVHLHQQRPLRALWALSLTRAALPGFAPIARIEDGLLALPEASLKALAAQLQGSKMGKMGKLGKPGKPNRR